MAVNEIPQSGQPYRVQPLDKDQASQKDAYRRKEKKNLKRAKKQEDLSAKSGQPHRVNLVV